MDPARQQLSIGLIGVLVGGTTGNSSATVTQIETVVRTQNLTKTQLLGVPTAPTTTAQSTFPVDTVPPIVAPPATPTTEPAFTVAPTTTTPGGGGGGPVSNDTQPPDPSNPPAGFCDTHVCGPSYAQGDGPAVQCADGVWTRQGGETVTCAHDGGLGKASGGP